MRHLNACAAILFAELFIAGPLLAAPPTPPSSSATSTPFAKEMTIVNEDGNVGSSELFATVPVGKRLVIQYMSARTILPAGQRPTVRCFASDPSAGASEAFLPMIFQFTISTSGEPLDWYVGSQPVLLYSKTKWYVM